MTGRVARVAACGAEKPMSSSPEMEMALTGGRESIATPIPLERSLMR